MRPVATLMPLLLLVALVWLVVACTQAAPTPTPPVSPTPQEVVTIDGVTYRAETRLEKSSPTADVAPVMVRSWVTITNTSDRPVEVRLEGCAARLRLYMDRSRSGTPVWTTETYLEREDRRCMQAPYTVALGPGESYETGYASDAARILNDSVPPGRYYFTIVLALMGRSLELAAGNGELTYGIEGLTFAAETSVVGTALRELHVVVTVTNTSDKRVGIEYGDCAVWVRVYRTADRSGEPAWDEENIDRVCLLYLADKELAPGESASPNEFRWTRLEPDILGDSLPNGHYYFAAIVKVNGTSVEVPAGEGELTRYR